MKREGTVNSLGLYQIFALLMTRRRRALSQLFFSIIWCGCRGVIRTFSVPHSATPLFVIFFRKKYSSQPNRYKALSTRNPGQYRWAYLGLAAAVVFNAVMVVGYVGHGGMGVFFCAHVLDKKESGALAIIAVIGCAMLGLQLAYFIYASYRVRSFYKEDVVRQALPSQLASAKEGVVGTSALKEKAKKQAIRSL